MTCREELIERIDEIRIKYNETIDLNPNFAPFRIWINIRHTIKYNIGFKKNKRATDIPASDSLFTCLNFDEKLILKLRLKKNVKTESNKIKLITNLEEIAGNFILGNFPK